MNKQLLKKSGADVLSSNRKLRKTLWGGGEGGWHPPPLYVRGLRDLLNVFMSIHPQTALLITFNCCILSFNLLAFTVPKKLEKKFVDLL